MSKRVFYVDFAKKQGKIKPLCCINGGPLTGGATLPHDMSEEYSDIRVPRVRCVMPCGSYGYNQYLCIHSLFPDFSLDENDEKSYNFAPTDRYLSAVRAAGCEIFLTLGEAAEPYERKLYAKRPTDLDKWARICEHIVMHYNECWAGGYKWNIKYLEIWDGADTDDGFFGEKEGFFELYRVAASHLKNRFPRLKIGGFGSMGFESQNRIFASEKSKRAFDFTSEFFRYVKSPKTQAPLDFFTWKCYAQTPEELSLHSKYARAYLDNSGLKKTMSIVAEYNLSKKGDIPAALREEYPAQLASSLIIAQKSCIDSLFYSSSEPGDEKNALYTVDEGITHRRYASYEVMGAFGELYALSTAVEVSDDFPRELYLVAAKGAESGMLVLSSHAAVERVEILLSGSEYTLCSVKKISSGGERGEGRVNSLENLKIAGNKIVLSAKPNEMFVITLS